MEWLAAYSGKFMLGPVDLFGVLSLVGVLGLFLMAQRRVSFWWGLFFAAVVALSRAPSLANTPEIPGPWINVFVAAFTLLTFAVLVAVWSFFRSIYLKKR